MYNKIVSILILILWQFSSAAAQSKIPAKINFNPIVADHLADPSIVSFDGEFYLYATTDIDQGLDKMGPPVVWKSHDFVNWHFEGLLETGIDWNRRYTYLNKEGKEKSGYFRYWAPGKVIRKNKKYYMYITIVKPDDKMGVYAMTADRPQGPFSFTNGKGLHFGADYDATDETKPLIDDIDGEPFVEENGKAFIYWRRRKAAALSSDWLTIQGKTIDIPTKFKGYSEGPGLFKRKGLYYYFYTLSGHASYSNGYMISKTGPLGPFEEPSGKNIFIYSDTMQHVWGPGHGNIFNMPGTDDWYFVYLEYGEGGTTRQIFVNRMEFNADGTIVPLSLNKKGVGYLASKNKRLNIAASALVTASSFRPSKVVEGKIAADEDYKTLHPELPSRTVRRTVSYAPQNAVDNDNGSRWMAAPSDAEPWISLDMGKPRKLKECEVFFVLPTAGQTWVLEKSMDGKKWDTCTIQREGAIRSPQVAAKPGLARYLRIKILNGQPGIWEINIY